LLNANPYSFIKNALFFLPGKKGVVKDLHIFADNIIVRVMEAEAGVPDPLLHI
jgi:hypothetical protein